MSKADSLPRAAFFSSHESRLEAVYGQGRRQELEGEAQFFPQIIGKDNFEAIVPQLSDLEVIFSTWGMPALTSEQLDWLPNLQAVFYAAGTVQGFAKPFIERDITVVSAWAANAVPVAEFTVAQIILANKGYFLNIREYTRPDVLWTAPRGKGNFGATVALLGAGMIGRHVIELLRPYQLRVVVFDPFLPEEAAKSLGVEKVSLEVAFSQSDVVSNHLANLPATVGMLKGEHFGAMKPGATFINTGRGATVAEDEMVRVLQERADIVALLDVTWPEPPSADSPLFTLPNVKLTSHIAGSTGDEVVRMADYVIEEFRNWKSGRPLRYSVSLDMLETMA